MDSKFDTPAIGQDARSANERDVVIVNHVKIVVEQTANRLALSTGCPIWCVVNGESRPNLLSILCTTMLMILIDAGWLP
jgi:hypothetical protein